MVETVRPTSSKRSEVIESLKKSPKVVKAFAASPRYRNKKMKGMGSVAKKSAKAISHRIVHAIKSEIEEVGLGVKFVKQLLTKGSPPLTKKQKKSVYSLGAYVAGATIAAVGGGMLVGAAAVGKSFSLHVGIKAVSHLADSLFLHYEWGVEASHAAHAFHGISKAMSHIAADKDADKDADTDLVQAMVLAVSKVLSDGMSEDDMKAMLSGKDLDSYDEASGMESIDKLKSKADDQKDSKKSDKDAALRRKVIRLAHTRPDLRPHLLPVIAEM